MERIGRVRLAVSSSVEDAGGGGGGGGRSEQIGSKGEGRRELVGGGGMRVFEGSTHGRPNHCLVNEYKPGQGISMHEDGNAYWPVVATVTLGGYGVLDVRRKRCSIPAGDQASLRSRREPVEKWRILQERGSLLITRGDVYENCLHGIEEVERDEGLEECANWGMVVRKEEFEGGRGERATRVSLTFRDVLRVKKLGKGVIGGFRREG